MEEIIKAGKVVKIYNYGLSNETTALDEVSFEMYEGEFVAVMGPSGSGKTTFINNMSTIDIPTKGYVKICGKNVLLIAGDNKGMFRYVNIGYIFQQFNLIDNMTLYENIELPLLLNDVNSKTRKTKIAEMAEKLKITSQLNKKPAQCSAGQRQRCAIARALIIDPEFIVADEPTGNLDSMNSHELMSFLAEINRENNVTILMVTHDPIVASYSNKLLYIQDGKIRETIERNEMSQSDYYKQISRLNSSEALNLLQKEG